jgi:hypothetical protein
MPQPNIRSFRDILVYLSAGDNALARLETAVVLARQRQARLIGVKISHKSVFDTERGFVDAELEETSRGESAARG